MRRASLRGAALWPWFVGAVLLASCTVVVDAVEPPEMDGDLAAEMPEVKVPLPLDDPNPRHPLTGSDLDAMLEAQFPGQFFTARDIATIAAGRRQRRRRRRQIDRDICCKTRLWFGEAPASLPDLVRGDSVTVLRGTRLRQAYSRGDCHTHNTTASDLCPPGGSCRQKRRIALLWVRRDAEAQLRYFLVNSHCAYEKS